MNVDRVQAVAMLAVLAIGAFVVYRIASKGIAGAAAGAVGAAGEAAGGAVLGFGDLIGIPRTDETLCEQAIREGRTFDASKYCSAGRFIGYVFGANEPELVTQPAAAPPKPGPAPAYDYGYGAGTGPLRPGPLPLGQAGAADGSFVFWGT